MNDGARAREIDPLEPPLQGAVDAVLAELLPDAALERVQQNAKRLSATSQPASVVPAAKRARSAWSFRKGLAAAAILAAVVLGVALEPSNPAGQAFAQMVENVRAARTVRLHSTIKLGDHVSAGACWIDGNRSRYEDDDGSWTTIVDVVRRKYLMLDMKHKRFHWLELEGEMALELANPIDNLRRITSNDAELVGEEVLDGRRTRIYRFNGAEMILGSGAEDFLETKVWIDAETQLPAMIVAHDPKLQLDVRYEGFVWDEPLDPQLFSLEPPEGFKPIESMEGRSQPSPVQPVVGH